jgi:hypothetical protein
MSGGDSMFFLKVPDNVQNRSRRRHYRADSGNG